MNLLKAPNLDFTKPVYSIDFPLKHNDAVSIYERRGSVDTLYFRSMKVGNVDGILLNLPNEEPIALILCDSNFKHAEYEIKPQRYSKCEIILNSWQKEMKKR